MSAQRITRSAATAPVRRRDRHRRPRRAARPARRPGPDGRGRARRGPAGDRPAGVRRARRRRVRRPSRCPCPTARPPRTSRCSPGCWSALRRARHHPHRRRRRRRRGRDHRPGRVRRRDLAARRARSCSSRPPCSAWSTPRSAARPAINIPEGKNLVGAFHPPAGRPVRPGHAGHDAARRTTSAGSPRWSRPGSSPTRRSSSSSRTDPAARRRPDGPHTPRARRARRPGQGRRRSPTTCSERGLREILNYGHTLGHAIEKVEGYRLAARRRGRRRHGLRRRARPARGPARRRERRAAPRPCSRRRAADVLRRAAPGRRCATAMRIDKKARGDRLRFVVLDGVGAPGRLEDPDRRPARSRLRRGAAR